MIEYSEAGSQVGTPQLMCYPAFGRPGLLAFRTTAIIPQNVNYFIASVASAHTVSKPDFSSKNPAGLFISLLEFYQN